MVIAFSVKEKQFLSNNALSERCREGGRGQLSMWLDYHRKLKPQKCNQLREKYF